MTLRLNPATGTGPALMADTEQPEEPDARLLSRVLVPLLATRCALRKGEERLTIMFVSTTGLVKNPQQASPKKRSAWIATR